MDTEPGFGMAEGVRSDARAVVLVEGVSDQRAVEALARRRGRDLEAERVCVVPIGGAQAIDRFLRRFGPGRSRVKLAGLCDAGEEAHFRRGLERAGLGADLTHTGMERLGFYVCCADLEDELIRALGVAAVEQVIDAAGELGSFRTLQKQAPWRRRPPEQQLRGSWAAAPPARSDTRRCSSTPSTHQGATTARPSARPRLRPHPRSRGSEGTPPRRG
jgi:hypothetical protein